jgi:hypothetical protein
MPTVDLLEQRLRNQQLLQSGCRTPLDVVRWLGAVQAQDYVGAKWAVGLRAPRLDEADIDAAFNDGSILRTHVMRPTWHFVTPADIRWMLELTAPRVIALMAFYDRKLELTAKVFAKSHGVLERALAGGTHLTRSELAAALGRAKIVAHGQRLGHLMMRAELDRVICSGPRRGKQFTYALLAERAPLAATLPRDEALLELTRRYLTSHGPATIRDFAWWSGLTAKDGKRGIDMLGSKIASRDIDGRTYWFVPSTSVRRTAPRSVYLLPNYDEYGIAYRNRDALLDGARSVLVSAGATEFSHMLIVNRRWTGSWKRTFSTTTAGIDVRPVRPLKKDESRALAEEAERYGTFFGLSTRLSIAGA